MRGDGSVQDPHITWSGFTPKRSCESVLGTVQVQQQLGLVFDSSNHRTFSRHDPVSWVRLSEDLEDGEERFRD